MSSAVPGRDPVETAAALERWFGERLGVADPVVSELSVPKAGFSNETILGSLSCTDGAGRHDRPFVLRIEPTSHQLFVQPDAMRQAQVMTALGGSVPVPTVWLTETRSDILGAPFFVMDRVFGRIPSDVPSWHRRGWTVDLAPQERARLHDGALVALAQLHAVDTSVGKLRFLDPVGAGSTALARQLSQLREFYEWCEPVRRYGADVIDAAMQYVITEMPDDDRQSIVWGDARVGNIVFADDLSVAALLDWEGATLGPPEVDVAWWVMFDEFLCEANGLTRLDGVPDRRGTLDGYEEVAGRALVDIGYYEVLAGLQFALINSRLAHLLITSGKAPEAVAAEFVTRVTGIMKRGLP
jgi:aminoglycoside phosphotransferase (APT) family kinase protein